MTNGLIGSEVVARAVPDGYTIMFHSVTSHILNPAFYPKLPYDTVNDFQSVTLAGDVPLALLANPALPVRNLKELVTLVKQQPGKMSYASFGVGSMSHLGGELLMGMLGLKMIHVPYKGGAPAMVDLIGGHVPLFFASMATVPDPVKAGKFLRAPDTVARLQAQGMAATIPGTPEQMTAYIRENLPRWAKVIREANIRID